MPEQEQKKIGVKLKAIDIIKITIDFLNNFSDTPGEFSFDINVECTPNIENKVILSLVHVDIKREGGDQVLGSLTIGCSYTVTRFDEVIRLDEQKNIKIAPHIINFINPLSISTTRGIMFAILRGTYLHNALLPIIEPLQLQN